MIVYRNKADLGIHLEKHREQGNCIGLVPTMGALHPGHASLVEKAVEECDLVVVTIFVNPTQFNDPSDLEHYPRTLDQDLDLLSKLNTDVVFVPAVEEMYPQGEKERSFDLSPLDSVMEGASRPGHFKGVAQIVTKLFELTAPRRAYFGQKDFQQLAIIRRLTELMQLPLQVIACPIVREKDGLAMSSRNKRLSKEERKLAPYIYEVLQEAREMRHALDPGEIRDLVEQRFDEKEAFELDYFELVDARGLMPVEQWDASVETVGCIAVQLGGVRLIDNLNFA